MSGEEQPLFPQSMRSISYDQLLAVHQEASQKYKADYATKTMRDIVTDIIEPVCASSKTSYALHLNPNGLKMDVFVSHSWDEPFGAFVESIRRAFLEKLTKPNLWICSFSLVQGIYNVIADDLDVPLDEVPFAKALRDASLFLVVRNSSIDLYSRIWCVCELIYAHKFQLYPDKTFVAGPDKFADLRTSVINAEASNDSDKAKILKWLLTENDYTVIDSIVQQFRAHANNIAASVEVQRISCPPIRHAEPISRNTVTPGQRTEEQRGSNLKQSLTVSETMSKAGVHNLGSEHERLDDTCGHLASPSLSRKKDLGLSTTDWMTGRSSTMHDERFAQNARASFADIERNGPPANPLPFGRARIGRAELVNTGTRVLNPKTGEILKISTVVYEKCTDGRLPQYAYWFGRKLKKSIFGVVKSCALLRLRDDAQVPWEVTDDKAAVKIMSWQKIRELRHIENPILEVAILQQVHGNPHVMGILEVLQDEDYIFMIMPIYSSGDLFGFVQQAGRFPEQLARYWFLQILDGLSHLQKAGVCHRCICLENILIHEYKTAVLIDPLMGLRIPYDDGHSERVTDVEAGILRRLIRPLHPCGMATYMAPEILKSEDPFDGFAIDLWSVGVVLFIMLVGVPPWEHAREEDPRYKMVVQGGLEQMLKSWRREISPAAADILQKMFQADPHNRLSLMEVMRHPWVLSKDDECILTAPTDAILD